jgi:hypothetical protein
MGKVLHGGVCSSGDDQVAGDVFADSGDVIYYYLFIYSLIACNLKVMAMVQKS